MSCLKKDAPPAWRRNIKSVSGLSDDEMRDAATFNELLEGAQGTKRLVTSMWKHGLPTTPRALATEAKSSSCGVFGGGSRSQDGSAGQLQGEAVAAQQARVKAIDDEMA